MIERYLEDLNRRLDTDTEELLLREWIDFSEGRCLAPWFSPRRLTQSVASVEWPQVAINDALDSIDSMVLQQFGECSHTLAAGNGATLGVRCNFGVSIMPSLFGAKTYIMDRNLNSLPTNYPLEGGATAIASLVEKGIPDTEKGWGANVFATAQKFREIQRRYPAIGKYIRMYHPDLQGPMDICELLWGNDLFTQFYENPDLVHAFLKLITETYITFMKKWLLLVPQPDAFSFHWGLLHKGTIMLRNDSAMNLSPDIFEEFIKPYDQQILDTFGGGAIHFCGKGDHFARFFPAMRNLYAVNLSQPHLNNMETIFTNTIDRGINIIGLPFEAIDSAVREGRNLHGRAHTNGE